MQLYMFDVKYGFFDILCTITSFKTQKVGFQIVFLYQLCLVPGYIQTLIRKSRIMVQHHFHVSNFLLRRDLHLYARQSEKSIFTLENFAEFIFADDQYLFIFVEFIFADLSEIRKKSSANNFFP